MPWSIWLLDLHPFMISAPVTPSSNFNLNTIMWQKLVAFSGNYSFLQQQKCLWRHKWNIAVVPAKHKSKKYNKNVLLKWSLCGESLSITCDISVVCLLLVQCLGFVSYFWQAGGFVSYFWQAGGFVSFLREDGFLYIPFNKWHWPPLC